MVIPCYFPTILNSVFSQVVYFRITLSYLSKDHIFTASLKAIVPQDLDGLEKALLVVGGHHQVVAGAELFVFAARGVGVSSHVVFNHVLDYPVSKVNTLEQR